MKRLSLYILVLFFILPYVADAQRWKRYRYELIGGIGTVNVFGDLGGGDGVARHNTLDFNVEGTRPVLKVAVRYKLKELLAVKTNVFFAFANASDKYTTNEARSNRGATTNTFFIEPSIQLEYSLIKERYGRRYTFSNIRRFSLSHVNTYVFVGIGGLFYFPNREINVDTGVGEPGVFAAAFPMGIGFKYAMNRIYTIGLEMGNRFTTTDYLDGHSDKFSQGNDSYFFLMLTVSKRLRTSRKGLPRF